MNRIWQKPAPSKIASGKRLKRALRAQARDGAS
jgi:hypothetical protein